MLLCPGPLLYALRAEYFLAFLALLGIDHNCVADRADKVFFKAFLALRDKPHGVDRYRGVLDFGLVSVVDQLDNLI